MLQIEKLEIKNFMSLRDVELSFEKNEVVIISGNYIYYKYKQNSKY